MAGLGSASLRVGVYLIAACAIVLGATGCDAAREDYANLSAEDARYNAFAIFARLQSEGQVPRETRITGIYRDIRPNGEEAWLAVLGRGTPADDRQTCLAIWAGRPFAELVHYQLFPCEGVALLLKPTQTTTSGGSR
jgi:hypothetical protein